MGKITTLFAILFIVSGCATGINSRQKMDLETYQARGLAIDEKSPGAAAALGLLPGGGSFYGRDYAMGVVNLLFWPLSMMWDPVSGYNAANRINYVETMEHVNRLRSREMSELHQKRMAGMLDEYAYNMELARISQRYDIDPISTPYNYNASAYQQPVQRTYQPQPAQRTYQQAPRNYSNAMSKEQQIQQLQQQDLPYDEYQRRYQQIMQE